MDKACIEALVKEVFDVDCIPYASSSSSMTRFAIFREVPQLLEADIYFSLS
jgi:hypothetical protein